jgi:hypothetical protein
VHASKNYTFAAVDGSVGAQLHDFLIAPVDAHAHPPRMPTTATPAHHRIT